MSMRRTSWPYLAAVFCLSIGYGIIVPLVPELKSSLSNSQISLLIAVYPFAKMIGYLGAASARIRRIHLLLPQVLAIICFTSMAISYAFPVLLAARLAEGSIFGFLMATISQKIAENNPEKGGSSLSQLNSLSSAGVFVGPIVMTGCIWAGFSKIAFLILACGMLISAVWALRLKSDKNISKVAAASTVPSKTNGQTGKWLAPSAYWHSMLPIMPVLLTFMVFDFTYGFLSFHVPVLLAPVTRDPSALTTLVFSSGFVIFTVFLPVFGYLADRLEGRDGLWLALLCIALLFGSAQFLGSVHTSIFIGLILVEFAVAAWCYAVALKRLSLLGGASYGLVGAAQSVGMTLGPLAAGWIWSGAPLIGLYILTFLYVLIGVVFCASPRTVKPLESSRSPQQ